MTEPVKIQYSLKPQSDTELGPLTATPTAVHPHIVLVPSILARCLRQSYRQLLRCHEAGSSEGEVTLSSLPLRGGDLCSDGDKDWQTDSEGDRETARETERKRERQREPQ